MTDRVRTGTDQVRAFADYVADDVAEQALKAHLNGHEEASVALYGVAAAVQRAAIDVLGAEQAEPGLWTKLRKSASSWGFLSQR